MISGQSWRLQERTSHNQCSVWREFVAVLLDRGSSCSLDCHASLYFSSELLAHSQGVIEPKTGCHHGRHWFHQLIQRNGHGGLGGQGHGSGGGIRIQGQGLMHLQAVENGKRIQNILESTHTGPTQPPEWQIHALLSTAGDVYTLPAQYAYTAQEIKQKTKYIDLMLD